MRHHRTMTCPIRWTQARACNEACRLCSTTPRDRRDRSQRGPGGQKESHPSIHPLPRALPQRHHRPPGHRRLHQRNRPPHGHHQPPPVPHQRRTHHTRHDRRHRTHHASSRRPQTQRRQLHNDFHNVGGMTALLYQLKPLLHLHPSALTITGQTLHDILHTNSNSNSSFSFPLSQQIIRPLSYPIYPSSSLTILHGNLSPGGAVLKASASLDRSLLSHRGPAVVFRSAADLALRIDSPDLPVYASSVLVLQNIGPRGHPGMPEAGLIPIQRKLARQGVKDMLRISDGRMSGTAGGTVVLHVSPEAAVVEESVLGVVRDGDVVRIDVAERRLEVEVGEEEVRTRIKERLMRMQEEGGGDKGRGNDGVTPAEGWSGRRGYRALYEKRVNQAEEGADFDFLTAKGAPA